jgi:hypothetical protein
MLRGVPLALLLVMAVTAPAEANDGPYLAGVAQVTGSPTTLPAVRGGGSAGAHGDRMVAWSGGSASALPRHGERQSSVAFPWLKQGRSGVAVALTERLRVGFGYRRLEGEDLWPEFADTGAADYDSHHLLIRASWRF